MNIPEIHGENCQDIIYDVLENDLDHRKICCEKRQLCCIFGQKPAQVLSQVR